MKTIKVTRLYTGSDGKSHFGEMEIDTKVVDFAPPAPPLGQSDWAPAEQYRFLLQHAGWVGDWHVAPMRLLFLVLAGECWIEVGNGERRQFAAGTCFLAEDKPGQGHRSGAISDVLMVLIHLPDNVPVK